MNIRITENASCLEIRNRKDFFSLYECCPIPPSERLQNLGLFLNRQTISRILFINRLYKKIQGVHGSVIEFGVRWGQNMSLFTSFRGMYEPYNHNRKIYGFDTFSGFEGFDEKDGSVRSNFSVTEGYENYLTRILEYQEKESPVSHIKKFDLIRGDASKTIKRFLGDHPEIIIALAYFDFDLYKPTKDCLEAILPYCARGTILAFDELNCIDFPGETIALREVIPLDKYRIEHDQLNPRCSFIEL